MNQPELLEINHPYINCVFQPDQTMRMHSKELIMNPVDLLSQMISDILPTIEKSFHEEELEKQHVIKYPSRTSMLVMMSGNIDILSIF